MAPDDELPRYLDAPEVAAALRLHVETLYRVIARGDLPAVKVAGRWRIRRQDVEALMAGPAMSLDARTRATVERWVDDAPPLSEKQKDIIAAAFRGAITQPKRRPSDAP